LILLGFGIAPVIARRGIGNRNAQYAFEISFD
jgi:hypothetical protein